MRRTSPANTLICRGLLLILALLVVGMVGMEFLGRTPSQSLEMLAFGALSGLLAVVRGQSDQRDPEPPPAPRPRTRREPDESARPADE